MAAQQVLKALIYGLATPHILVARIAFLFRSESLETDFSRCLDIVDQYSCSAPAVFINALIVAEDRRSLLHPGIDPIGILRAIRVRLFEGQIQGASTIEQQFVRVVTARYERTAKRKLREQVLALLLSKCRSKAAISSAYLSIAFFGSQAEGLRGIEAEFGSNTENLDPEKVLKFVAQLKYPRPLAPTVAWRSKVDRRVIALKRFSKCSSNNEKTLRAKAPSHYLSLR